MASRWPMRARHELDLQLGPSTRDFACGALVAEVDVPEPIGLVVFVNCLPSWKRHMEFEREQQTVRTARFIDGVLGGRERPVIVAGDLDAEPEAASVRFWCGRQALEGMSVCYVDAWANAHPDEAGHTVIADNALRRYRDWPGRRIDYVLVRCTERGRPSLAVSACARAFADPIEGVWASDHAGVYADLEALSDR